ncbi:MAG: hypothetical protein A2W22_00630 [Candidatus Levybacteria bacterium RBG_16_35_11]|nr:MAG: hypothetical protein A2W22_00630 [Candidatus Levybacteria bacterium RBG_16_35_11]
MTKHKKNKDFSHIETDKLKATFIENPESETAKRLQKELLSPKAIVIKIGEYLKTDDPIIKDCEIALQGFVPVLDHAKDEVLYVKIKPQEKTIIYHLTPHPDSQKALSEIALEAKKKGFTMMDSKIIIQQTADMFKKKRAGTLKMRDGRHPKMDYLDK